MTASTENLREFWRMVSDRIERDELAEHYVVTGGADVIPDWLTRKYLEIRLRALEATFNARGDAGRPLVAVDGISVCTVESVGQLDNFTLLIFDDNCMNITRWSAQLDTSLPF